MFYTSDNADKKYFKPMHIVPGDHFSKCLIDRACIYSITNSNQNIQGTMFFFFSFIHYSTEGNFIDNAYSEVNRS